MPHGGRRRLPVDPAGACRRSIVSRCAGATRRGCTCSCGTTTSSPRWSPRSSTSAASTRCSSRARSSRDGVLSFVYKAAAEIGELGDNTAALRAAIVDDTLLRRALMSPLSRLAVLGHTRWASVGIISEPNTHPLNSVELEQPGGALPPYVVAALNGDVDNHADLRVAHNLRIAAPITTDAKVIPTLMSRHLDTGVDHVEAFRRTVSSFEGSVAIGTASADPNRAACSSRSAAAGRVSTSAWPTTVRSSPASPTAWSRRRASTCASMASTAARSWSCRRAGRAPSPVCGASPTTAPTCPSPTTTWSPPRSPPATSTGASHRTSC